MLQKIGNLLISASSLILLFTSNSVFAWGQNGHRIVAQIANSHLTPATVKALEPLLEGESLPQVATWADEMRSAPGEFWQKKSSRWHYINADATTLNIPPLITLQKNPSLIFLMPCFLILTYSKIKTAQLTRKDSAYALWCT